jgi:biotin carboxylase
MTEPTQRRPRGDATLLFLGASVSQLPSIRYARESGFRVVAVDGNPRAVAFPYADVAEPVDFTDLAHVAAVASRNQVDGILAISSDRAVVPAATVAAALGLPGIGVVVAEAMTHKQTMRRQLEQAAVPQPRHTVLTHDADLSAALSFVGAPAVLKPADSGGQRGVFRIQSERDLGEHLPDALALSRTGQAMLEEFVPGTELNGLLVVRGGEPQLLSLSDRLRPPGVGFGVGWIHLYPSALSERGLASARSVAELAVRALGLRDGIAFPQLIVGDDEEARLIEIAARIPAGQMADLLRHATGIELFDIAFAQALGRPVSDDAVTPSFTRPIAIRFLTARPGVLPVGTVRRVVGMDEVRAAPGVLDAGLYFDVGDSIAPVRVDADRMGYVVASGDTAAAALARADAAAMKLNVEADEHSGDVPSARPAGSRRRRSRGFVAGLVGAVGIAAIAAALILADGPSTASSLVQAGAVTAKFSPVCRCRLDVAHIAFRVLRRARLTVEIVSSAGRPVDTLLRDVSVSPGWEHLSWNGRDTAGAVSPIGRYRALLDFVSLHREIALPQAVLLSSRGGTSSAQAQPAPGT